MERDMVERDMERNMGIDSMNGFSSGAILTALYLAMQRMAYAAMIRAH